jgi:hypothetical protein
MTKIQSAFGSNVLDIDYWNLRFICNLVLGIWDFIIYRLRLVRFQRILCYSMAFLL